MSDCVIRHNQKHCDVQERKAVWQSVLDVEAVPDIVQDIKGKTKQQKRTQSIVCQPLPQPKLSVKQVQKRQQNRCHAAVHIQPYLCIGDIHRLQKCHVVFQHFKEACIKFDHRRKFVSLHRLRRGQSHERRKQYK